MKEALSSRSHPPAADELEISIFGPGFGESVVIHIGAGRWILIDSCIDTNTGIPAALDYLNALSASPEAVELIVATHWHDDHVRGLATMVNACSTAQFACSAGLNSHEFLALASLYAECPTSIPAGPTELKRAFEQVIARRKTPSYRPIKWARSDTLIWDQRVPIADRKLQVRLHALSPSDEMLTRAMEEMAQAHAAATQSDQVTLPISGRPNHLSVALRLEIGDYAILLGSDLEENENPLTGWSAVLATSQATEKPSSVYKVAHHGSYSGHCERVWTEMLTPNPLALLTPFRWGRHRLPNPEDRERILGLTKRAYITADPELEVAPKKRRKPKVEEFLNITTKRRWIAAGSMGQIRFRSPLFDALSSGQISTFLGAKSLAEVVARS